MVQTDEAAAPSTRNFGLPRDSKTLNDTFKLFRSMTLLSGFWRLRVYGFKRFQTWAVRCTERSGFGPLWLMESRALGAGHRV